MKRFIFVVNLFKKTHSLSRDHKITTDTGKPSHSSTALTYIIVLIFSFFRDELDELKIQLAAAKKIEDDLRKAYNEVLGKMCAIFMN